MLNHSGRSTDDSIEGVVNRYSNMLFKLCFTVLCNNADAEDAVADTFLRYITKPPFFQDEEHTKAWLIRVATNICKDMHRFNKRHNYIDLDELYSYSKTNDNNEILLEIMNLPEKHKTVIHLFYIEGYNTNEISKILSISPSAARKRLQYARDRLKFQRGKETLA